MSNSKGSGAGGEGARKRHRANTLNITSPKGTSAAARVHDHEGFIALPRTKAFTTPKPFTKNAVMVPTGE
jgi:hypothetical protein